VEVVGEDGTHRRPFGLGEERLQISNVSDELGRHIPRAPGSATSTVEGPGRRFSQGRNSFTLAFAAMADEAASHEQGIEAMRASLTTLLDELRERDAVIVELRETISKGRVEATRLRKELNAAHSAKAEKMMDVAMVASVQTMQDEAAASRRALMEQCILCDELRATEVRADWSERVVLS
jgi:hypothetical protein